MRDRHSLVLIRCLLMTASLSCVAPCSYGFDVLRAERDVEATPAGPYAAGIGGCDLGEPATPLRLADAVARALCRNPETRAAWADVKAHAAALGVTRAAYLPTISLSGQAVRQDVVTDVTDHPALSSATRANVYSGNATLTWLLYDFGARSAAVRNASALLDATRWTQNAVLLTVYVTVAKDYYAAQAAAGLWAAARETASHAADAARVARARVDKGVAPITDVLQADTALQQAEIATSRARGDWLTARGTLAADLDLDPDFAFELPQVTGDAMPETRVSQSIRDLIDDVKRTHPSVLAAERQVDAADARADQIRAAGLPSLSLTGKYGRNNQPASQGLGIPQYRATGREWYVGFQVSIPLFEGFGRGYQVRQVLAERDRQEALLESARQKAALEVWSSYQALGIATDTVAQSEALLRTALKSSDAAEKRYRAGVGNILEVLNVQKALAEARQRRVEAIADWNRQRVRLGGALGRVGDGNFQ